MTASEDVDSEIRERFQQHIVAALNKQYMDWCKTAYDRLALILLLNQFTRNIYRKSSKAFSGDTLTVDLCLAGIASGHDQLLSIPQRSFYSMPLALQQGYIDGGLAPLEHQNDSVRLFAQLAEHSYTECRRLTENSYHYASNITAVPLTFGEFS